MAQASKSRWSLLKVSPLFLVPLVLVLTAPWLKSIDRTLLTFASMVTAIFVMGYATYLSILWHRGLDEVQKAGSLFGAEWGVLGGTIAFALLLNLPPFRYFTSVLLWDWAGYPDAEAGRRIVILAMAFAFCGVVVLQTLGRLVANIFWWKKLDQ
jgi:hypothetical protein